MKTSAHKSLDNCQNLATKKAKPPTPKYSNIRKRIAEVNSLRRGAPDDRKELPIKLTFLPRKYHQNREASRHIFFPPYPVDSNAITDDYRRRKEKMRLALLPIFSPQRKPESVTKKAISRARVVILFKEGRKRGSPRTTHRRARRGKGSRR